MLILIGGHLATAPRPQKEAMALHAAGADVRIRGSWWSDQLAGEDQEIAARIGVEYRALVDLRPGSRGRFVWRMKHRLARDWFRLFKMVLPRAFGIGGPEFLQEIRRLEPELVMVHSEATLWAASRLRNPRIRIGVDMEDWFSEQECTARTPDRPRAALREIEKALLRKAACSFCPSGSMSRGLAAEYECVAPTVIYNVFPWAERALLDRTIKDRRNTALPSVHWYSQTLGPGRGLEDLVGALPMLQHPAEVHLRGNPAPGFESWLWAHVPAQWRNRVFLHRPVPNVELLSRVAEHDIGFAGELKCYRSRDLTVTNKVFHYLLGGLAVIASDTTGQREIAVAASDAIWVYPSGDAAALAKLLNALLSHRERLHLSKVQALRAAETQFCWERQSPVLLDSVRRALGG